MKELLDLFISIQRHRTTSDANNASLNEMLGPEHVAQQKPTKDALDLIMRAQMKVYQDRCDLKTDQ
jgi:hypothetical protein